MHQTSVWSFISHRCTIYFLRSTPSWHRSPNMPVGRNFTATAVVCLQTLIRFVRFLTCCFCHTLCAPNAFRTLIPHAFLECVLPMGRPTLAGTGTIKADFQSARFGFRKTSNYIFISCLCFAPPVFYSVVPQAFHFQTSKSQPFTVRQLYPSRCNSTKAETLKLVSFCSKIIFFSATTRAVIPSSFT